jgi:hypothetical protein
MSNLTDSLAAKNTAKMNENTVRDNNWMKAYMETLLNPFSTTLKSPKLLDGEIKNTAAIKLRATGEIVCSATGNTNIVLFPGLTNVICYCSEPTGTENSSPATGLDKILINGTVFKSHLSAASDRAVVRLARLTGAGARFFLTNSCEEDDGYWEACRITNHNPTQEYFTKNDVNGLLGAGIMRALTVDFDLANNPTYQFGQLRDLYKFVFKLNSEDEDHKFSPVSGFNKPADLGTGPLSLADMEQWDMVFIKVRGRRNATSPSVLRFDTVANEELVYAEDSPLARLMDETPRENNILGYLAYSRVELPAFQAVS